MLLAGIAKLRHPGPTRVALAGAGLTMPALAVPVLGGGEVVVGTVVLMSGNAVAAAVLSFLYACFTAFTVRQLGRGSGACGCFGSDTEVTRLHAGLDATLAAAAAGGVVMTATGSQVSGLPVLVAGDPVAGMLTSVLVATSAALVRLLMTGRGAHRSPGGTAAASRAGEARA